MKWDDDKGFGFIGPDEGSGDVFAHIKAVVGGRRPVEGDRVFYFPGKDERGRARATQVQFATTGGMPPACALALTVTMAFLAALALAAWLGRITPIFPVIYGMMSAVAFAAYWHDKNSAKHGAWRLPESSLHALELFGGWPGALVAQQWLRHKNRKLSYQIIFWLIVAAHTGAWVYLGSRK